MRHINSAFCSRSRSISEIYALRVIIDTMRMCAVVQFHLLVGRRNANDLVGPRRQLLKHRIARAAKKHRPQVLPQLVEILVAQHLAFFIDDAMAMKETESRRQAAIVDELDHRVQLIQPVFQRRAAQDECERRLQPLDDSGRLRLPVS